jgi:hypothetical protein
MEPNIQYPQIDGVMRPSQRRDMLMRRPAVAGGGSAVQASANASSCETMESVAWYDESPC